MKILCIGEEWRGSNASGLFYALSRCGALVQVINEQKYISTAAEDFLAKALNKVVRGRQVSDYNAQLIKATDAFRPDLVLVYKGTFVQKHVVEYWKSRQLPVVNFFPDVSFLAHGSHIPECIPLYDHIFTTKTFGASDLESNFGYAQSNVTFVPHAFDPQVHRKVNVPAGSNFICDASFIGNYSVHKSRYLSYVSRAIDLKLNIWGSTWNTNKSGLEKHVQGVSISGDLYALAINASTVNIALLSEKVAGASQGDQITSRTFHITGAGGFMLHQRTEELRDYFKEDEEVACFDSEEELADKLRYYLSHPGQRQLIQRKGYERAQRFHSMDQRARLLLDLLEKKFNLQ